MDMMSSPACPIERCCVRLATQTDVASVVVSQSPKGGGGADFEDDLLGRIGGSSTQVVEMNCDSMNGAQLRWTCLHIDYECPCALNADDMFSTTAKAKRASARSQQYHVTVLGLVDVGRSKMFARLTTPVASSG